MRSLRLLFLVAMVPLFGLAQEWTRFRGPNGNGAGVAPNLPQKWTEKDALWTTSLPGVGHASPVLWGDKVFVTGGDKKSGKRHIACVAADSGKILWQKEFAGGKYKTHNRNSIATATPAVDAERLYVTWGTPQECLVQALDHQGKLVWQKDLGPYPSQHGFGSSPILFEDLVIVLRQPDGAGELVALDQKTGEVRWKLAREGKNATYSTPCIYQQPGGQPEVITTNWQLGITGVHPRTGKILWELPVFERNTQMRAIGSPVVAGDLVLGISGFAAGLKQLVAVRPANPTTGEKAKEVWRLDRNIPQMATPLLVGNRVYLLTEQNQISCLEAATGKVLWQERLPIATAGSPVLVGDRILCAGTDGSVVVVGTGDRYEVLAQNSLGEATQATPAIAGGRLIFRTERSLIAFGPK